VDDQVEIIKIPDPMSKEGEAHCRKIQDLLV
jgi:hypothetical protein